MSLRGPLWSWIPVAQSSKQLINISFTGLALFPVHFPYSYTLMGWIASQINCLCLNPYLRVCFPGNPNQDNYISQHPLQKKTCSAWPAQLCHKLWFSLFLLVNSSVIYCLNSRSIVIKTELWSPPNLGSRFKYELFHLPAVRPREEEIRDDDNSILTVSIKWGNICKVVRKVPDW